MGCRPRARMKVGRVRPMNDQPLHSLVGRPALHGTGSDGFSTGETARAESPSIRGHYSSLCPPFHTCTSATSPMGCRPRARMKGGTCTAEKRPISSFLDGRPALHATYWLRRISTGETARAESPSNRVQYSSLSPPLLPYTSVTSSNGLPTEKGRCKGTTMARKDHFLLTSPRAAAYKTYQHGRRTGPRLDNHTNAELFAVTTNNNLVDFSCC